MNKKIIIGILICLVLVGGAIAADQIDKKEKKDKYDDGNEMLDYIEYFETEKDYQVTVVGIEQKYNSNELEISWRMQLFDAYPYEEEECTYDEEDPMAEPVCNTIIKEGREYFLDEVFTSKIDDQAKDKDIIALVTKHAEEFYSSWAPTLILEIDRSSVIREEIELDI